MKNETANILSLVSYKFLPPIMGGQKNIAFFNRYLNKNINLTCITVKENEPRYEQGYTVHNILSNSKLRYINLFYFFKLKQFIQQHQITHLIVEHPYYGWLGLLLSYFCKLKLIVHSHNIEATRFKSLRKWWWGILWHYEKLTHKKADLNFFIHDDDRNFAIGRFKLDPAKCITITYGFELEKAPATEIKAAARKKICDEYSIDPGQKILLFNGTLNYLPNLEALDIILKVINPLLLAEQGFTYKIIICGDKLPAVYKRLDDFKEKNIIYAGFVEDIGLFFKGADIFINPVIEGGGIKTKVVEALGYGLSVISSKSGATGIPQSITGDKMIVVEDGEWENFARQVALINIGRLTPAGVFEHFYWGNIAQKAATAIQQLKPGPE